MGDFTDRAKEMAQDAMDRLRGGGHEKQGEPPDEEREAQRRAAAAAGGTPDVPVGTEEDARRQAQGEPPPDRP